MSSCRLRPPCWMKMTWSTPAASNFPRCSDRSSGVPMPEPDPTSGSLSRAASNRSQTLVRPGRWFPNT